MITAADIQRETGRNYLAVWRGTKKIKIHPVYTNPVRYFYTERQKDAVVYLLKKWKAGHRTNKIIKIARDMTRGD